MASSTTETAVSPKVLTLVYKMIALLFDKDMKESMTQQLLMGDLET